MDYTIHTIGYQKESFSRFEQIVGGVLVIDVRRFTQSRYKPDFSKNHLCTQLKIFDLYSPLHIVRINKY